MESKLLLINPRAAPASIPFTKLQPQHQLLVSKPITSLSHATQTSAAHKKPISRSTHLPHNASLQEAISALENGSQIRPKTFISLLQSCIDCDSIADGRRLHSSIGLVIEPNPFVETKLVSMYAKCGSLEEARKVFDGMSERNLYTWSAMIGGYSRDQRWEEVVELFFKMTGEGFVPDAFLIPKILQACSNIGDVETGRLLHSIAVRCGYVDSCEEEAHVSNSIMAMYAKSGELELAKRFFEKLEVKNLVSWNAIISGHCQFGENEEALRLFEQMGEKKVEPGLVTWNILITSYNQCGNPERAMDLMEQMERAGIFPDVVTWTSMISGFVHNNKPNQALDLFQEMITSEVEPNGMTIASVISACADLRSLRKGKEIHSYAVKIEVVDNLLVSNALIDMYAKCGSIVDSERLFDGMSEKDVYTWNSMIGGYTLAGCCSKAYELFLKMETFGVCRNVVTWNVLMSGYIQNGDEDEAMELFERMEKDGIEKNTASWNTLISGFLQNGELDKALNIFRQMQSNLVRPNSITILSILPAFANLASIRKIKEIHASILHNDLQSETSIANALISSYSNSGEIEVAHTVFKGLRLWDIISWNSIISGSVLCGLSHLARDLFSQMMEQHVKPNQATLTSMILAYSLDRMVKEGMDLFSSMIENYQISPAVEHYTAMVKLLGRAGRLGEACELVKNMPLEPDSTVWNALLTAGIIHGNVKVASLAAEELLRLEPDNSKCQRLLTNVQAFIGKAADQVMRPRRESNTDVSHDHCWVEETNKSYTFCTGDNPSSELEAKLEELNIMTKEKKASTIAAIHGAKLDIEEPEENGSFLGEKLALAFGLVRKSSSGSIRIVKSAKICTTSHTFFKLASQVYKRKILLKDPKCLHIFKDGKCSCRDFW